MLPHVPGPAEARPSGDRRDRRRPSSRFAVAFSEMSVLVFSRVAARSLHMPPLCRWRW